jgi:hypothetical protein
MGKSTKPREEVAIFLKKTKTIMQTNDSMLTVVQKEKNDAFRMTEGLRTNRQVIKFLNMLEVKDYMYNDDQPQWFVFEFPYTTVEGKGIYVFIRLSIQDTKGMVVCLSIHPAEFDPRPSLIYKD